MSVADNLQKIVVLCVLAIAVIAVVLFVDFDFVEAPVDEGDITACTLDAKICPDGSAVGRVGPNCEFAACPGEGSDDQELIIEAERVDPTPQ